jgi:hypothetical protein
LSPWLRPCLHRSPRAGRAQMPRSRGPHPWAPRPLGSKEPQRVPPGSRVMVRG